MLFLGDEENLFDESDPSSSGRTKPTDTDGPLSGKHSAAAGLPKRTSTTTAGHSGPLLGGTVSHKTTSSTTTTGRKPTTGKTDPSVGHPSKRSTPSSTPLLPEDPPTGSGPLLLDEIEEQSRRRVSQTGTSQKSTKQKSSNISNTNVPNNNPGPFSLNSVKDALKPPSQSSKHYNNQTPNAMSHPEAKLKMYRKLLYVFSEQKAILFSKFLLSASMIFFVIMVFYFQWGMLFTILYYIFLAYPLTFRTTFNYEKPLPAPKNGVRRGSRLDSADDEELEDDGESTSVCGRCCGKYYLSCLRDSTATMIHTVDYDYDIEQRTLEEGHNDTPLEPLPQVTRVPGVPVRHAIRYYYPLHMNFVCFYVYGLWLLFSQAKVHGYFMDDYYCSILQQQEQDPTVGDHHILGRVSEDVYHLILPALKSVLIIIFTIFSWIPEIRMHQKSVIFIYLVNCFLLVIPLSDSASKEQGTFSGTMIFLFRTVLWLFYYSLNDFQLGMLGISDREWSSVIILNTTIWILASDPWPILVIFAVIQGGFMLYELLYMSSTSTSLLQKTVIVEHNKHKQRIIVMPEYTE